MRRVLKAIMFAVVSYVIPLVTQPFLIIDPRIVFLMLTCVVVLLTQPDFSLRVARQHAGADGYSVVMIMVAAAITQIAPVVEWSHRTAGEWNAPWIVIGALVMLGGTALRIWAIKTLGRFFTSTVTIQQDHQLIKHGPYRYIRHPSYLGAYLAMIGSSILLRAPFSIGIVVVVMGGAYAYRIRLEERELRKRFAGVTGQFSRAQTK